jgi:AbrB family looped-hinge helix DNA binding protein
VPTAIVSAKGWIVIPKAIRKRHGLKKGDRVYVIDAGERISIFPADEDPIGASYGMLKGGPSMTQSLLEDRRWELEKEEEGLPPPHNS